MYDLSLNLDNNNVNTFKTSGSLVAGPALLAQKFYLFLLNEVGSDPLFNFTYGSDIFVYLTYNNFTIEADFIAWFEAFCKKFLMWLETTYTDRTPDTEKAASIELITYNIVETTIKLTVKIVTVAGSNTSLALTTKG